MTSPIPLLYRWLALLALAVALLGFGWVKGASHVQARWDDAVGRQALATVHVQQRQAEATVKVVTQYVDRVRTVHVTGETLIKEVPIYVSPDSPALPGGFRMLHDAAALGQLPDPARVADAPAVPAQDAAATVAANYLTCRENAEQLTALQSWIREQYQLQ